MFTNTDTIKLFDKDHNFVNNFDEEIEKILISIHGENYYDSDEDYNEEVVEEIYVDEELDKTMEIVSDLVTNTTPKIEIKEKEKKENKLLAVIPVIFYILIFTILVFGGYYFLRNIDLMGLVS